MAGSAVDAAIIVDPASASEPDAAASASYPERLAPVSGDATVARSQTADDIFELGDDRLQELPEALIWLTMMLGCLGVGFALHRGDTEVPVRMRFP